MAGPFPKQALSGVSAVEIGGGVAAAYCGRLLVDCGAPVLRFEPEGGDPLDRRREVLEEPATEGLLSAYLNAGKTRSAFPNEPGTLHDACRAAEIVIVGEDCTVEAASLGADRVVVDLRWFAESGDYAGWKGSDIVVQALTGMMHLAGPVEGPPNFMGDCQAAFIGGLTAYVAAMAGLLAPRGRAPRRFDVSILEANLIISELQLAYAQASGEPAARAGVNRFKPNCPVGIYPCGEGWLGLSALTPAQWQSLCAMLGMEDLAADPDFETSAKRHARADDLEAEMIRALAARSAQEWAQEGRRLRIPMVPVPDARGILDHPVFAARSSLASFETSGQSYKVPRTPFAMTRTPPRMVLDDPAPSASGRHIDDDEPREHDGPPLEGIRVTDFSMGWAGPLVTRIMADLGADILKIEAGRYPDWWRAVDWSPEAIAGKQYEAALHFAALNRGKRGVGLDLTTPEGRDLALTLISRSDAVVENQAAGVMDKLGLGYGAITAARPDIVMMSMSAFGTGNAWSDTRAYGSTLEHGSGLPSFSGQPDARPSMGHLAYGDAVGGLYGCGALLTALVHRRRSGEGQFVNLGMVECMLQFTAPALLTRQATGEEPPRRGNRHAALAPHGCFAAAGADQWVALAVTDERAFAALARLLGHEEWLADGTSLGRRVKFQGEVEEAIAAWTGAREAGQAARELQEHGIAAAPVVHVEDLPSDRHLDAVGFFADIDRPISKRQRQAGLAITENGRRFCAARPAPMLGGDTKAVLAEHAQVDDLRFEAFCRSGVVSLRPTALRTAAAAAVRPAERRGTG